MKGFGLVQAGMAGLRVQIEWNAWGVLLRRADYAPDPGFGRLHNAPVRSSQLQPFLPNWPRLDWNPVPPSILGTRESWAIDPPYHVTLQAEASARLTQDELIAAFQRFMAYTES